MRRSLFLLVLCLFVLAAAPGAQAIDCPPATPTSMTMSDGAKLGMGLRWPATANGPLPLVVMQSGWGGTWGEYEADSCWLAARGWAVVMYTARGFRDLAEKGRGSQGQIDVAGDRTVRDMSEVIDQALKLKFPVGTSAVQADPAKIGVLGISYGAGVGLMASARDKRIKAMVAFSPWQDLTRAMFPNQTRKAQAIGQLYIGGLIAGTPTAEFNDVVADAFANRNVAKTVAFGDKRGVKASISQFNANKTPLFLYAGYEDGFFDPNQVRDLYTSVTGPKRIELSPGEHSQRPKGTTNQKQNEIWVRASDWLDRYVRGIQNGIDKRPPIQIDPVGPAPAEGYASFAAAAPKQQTLTFGPRTGPEGGSLNTTGQRSWRWKINGGWSSAADNGIGIAFLTGIIEQLVDQKIVTLPWWHVDQTQAAIWTSAPFPNGIKLRGPVTIRGQWKTTRTDQATMIAYLYDRDAWGTLRLVTSEPWTDRAMKAGVVKPFSFELSDEAYDLPAGHRLTVVVDTTDQLFMDQTPAGATLTFTGSRQQPWTLEIPYR